MSAVLRGGDPPGSRQAIADLLNAIRDVRVLVVGDILLDEYVGGDCTRMSAEAPVPIVRYRGTRRVLGGAANTAANISALGARAALLGRLGNDEAGRTIGELCDTSRIHLCSVDDGLPTVRKVRVLAQEQQLLRIDYEEPRDLTADAEHALLDRATRELAAADVVVVSDYAKGVVTRRVAKELIARAGAAGKRIVIDPRPQHASFYLGCDYLLPNWREARALLGRTDLEMNEGTIFETGRLLRRRYRSNIVLTLGERGIAFVGRDSREQFIAPSTARAVFDVSGAGDTVVAAWTIALAAGCDHRTAVWLANRAAGIVVGKRGTATVTPAEVLAADSDAARLLDTEMLGATASALRAGGMRVATVCGTFERIEAEHLETLESLRRRSDAVIVGVTDRSCDGCVARAAEDASLARERAAALLGLRAVDYVHITRDPEAFVRIVDADLHVDASHLSRGDLSRR